MLPVPSFFSAMAGQSEDGRRVSEWVNKYISERTDPAAKAPGSPPLYGSQAVPHLMTFQSLIGTYSRSYLNPDEAVRDSVDNAHLMLKDVGILECLDNRRRLTALLRHEIVPEDEKCPFQKSVARELTRCVERIRRFTEYKYWLMSGIWSGRAGIQHRYGYVNVSNRMRIMPKPLHRDHYGWLPINGDKLVFRFDDGRQTNVKGAYPHQCGIRVAHAHSSIDRLGQAERRPEPTGDGLALFLTPWERDTMCIHKHFIEDADYHHSHFSGSIHGIGIRSKIYWEWWLKQEAMAFLMQYLERSAGGVEIYFYPANDEQAKASIERAAEQKRANGRNVLFFPRPMGEDASAYDYQVVETGMSGLDIIKDLVQSYFGGRIKRYILGQVLTTEAEATGLGSGVADAHLDTLQQIVCYDARNLEETLTEELIEPIQRYNFPETLGWRMRLKLKTDDDDAKARLESYQAAYEMGAAISEQDIFDIIGASAPGEGENVLQMNSGGMGMGMPGMMPPMQDGDGDGRVGQAEQMDDQFLQQYSANASATDPAIRVKGRKKPERMVGRIRNGVYQGAKT